MALPSYLSRHINLGFDKEDVAALLTSIEASQTDSETDTQSDEPVLPHLPAEILLSILEYVPIDHVLNFRSVCKGFRDCIDTRVLFSYLPRTELLGYVAERDRFPGYWTRRFLDDLQWIRAKFSHLEDLDGSARKNGAKWDGTYAVFDLDGLWFDTYADYVSTSHGLRGEGQALDAALGFLDESWWGRDLGPFAKLGWFIKLEKGVMDVSVVNGGLLEGDSNPAFKIDVEAKTVKVKWKTMLMDFLRSENSIRRTMEDTNSLETTYGLDQDCIRDVRRNHARNSLDLNEKSGRLLAWGLRLLQPLFGRSLIRNVPREVIRFQKAENKAMKWIMLWRRAASRTAEQQLFLEQLAEDRDAMTSEVERLSELFGQWKKNMYDVDLDPKASEQLQVSIRDFTWEELAQYHSNPLFWSDETISKEAERVNKWQSQAKMREAMEKLLEESVEALTVPEDSFDHISSDF